MYQSLHVHTTISDGKHSYEEVLKLCPKYNIDTVAFTDHDALPNINNLLSLKSKNFNTKWLLGIEISSGLPKELGGKINSGCHLIGLFINPENSNLITHCEKAQKSRIDRMQKIVSNLVSLGFNITEADCLAKSCGESVGRPHIVAALNSKKDNIKIIKKYFERLRREKDKKKIYNELFEKISNLPKNDWPYYLFLSTDSYIRDIYVDYFYYKNFDDSVKLIRDAGGVAILAHYFTISNVIDSKLLEILVKNKRIDGLEIIFGINPINNEEINLTIDKERNIVQELCNRYNCYKSGGVDFHEEQHFEQLIKSKYVNQTKNLFENIYKNIDKKDYFQYFNI